MANIIIAICLRVDRAMIFFKSCSQFADILAYNAVDLEMISNRDLVIGWIDDVNRSNKNTPAVTNVEEWTKAEIGVGAAIAMGSQAENGNCALFEQPAIVSIVNTKNDNSEFRMKFQFVDNIIIPIESRIRISPIRLLRRVIVPDEAEEKFW